MKKQLSSAESRVKELELERAELMKAMEDGMAMEDGLKSS